MAAEVFRKTVLPAETPKKAFVTPTLNRWGDSTKRGHLPTMMGSLQKKVSEEDLSDSWMILGDSSPNTTSEARDYWASQELDKVPFPSRVFILRPELQREVADAIQQKTGLRETVIDAILLNTGYASQRQKIDAVVAAAVLNGNPIDILTLDDDTLIPSEYKVIKQNALPDGLLSVPNSQVLWPGNDLTPDNLDSKPNALSPFFEHLGNDVDQIRMQRPSLRATRTWKDTMHETLETLNGHPAQFVVTHANENDIPESGKAKIVAAAATKHGVPDYRTVKIADFNLRREFPEDEMPVKSYLSGETNPFAFVECDTNIDSAALARRFDSKTAIWPWWFVSSLDISLQNPLETVTSHYRADNELLPVLLKVIKEQTGESNMYLSGIDSQVYHNRARSGYRPDLHEQAAASLVGNVVALAAADKLVFGPYGHATLKLDGRYKVPQGRAHKVFAEMAALAETCLDKAEALRSEKFSTQLTGSKIEKYNHIYNAIRRKLANFDFNTFATHLEEETNKQLQFYADVLYATPIVIGEIQQMIKYGRYPVLEYVPEKERNTSYPQPTVVFERSMQPASLVLV